MSRHHSLSKSSLGPRGRGMGDIDIGDVSVTSLNPIAVMTAAFTGFANGVASASVAEANAAGDNVGASADGSGSISMSDFKNIGGVCTPANFVALGFAMTLQQQMNRVAAAKSWSKIGVDGKIGPGTMALFKKIKAAFPTQIMGDTSSCAYIAADADVLADQVGRVADSLKVPAKVAAPASAGASIVTKSGKVVMAPQSGGIGVAAIDGALGGMSTAQKVVFGGLVGGIGYVLYKKSKKSTKGKRR